jgi:glycerol-3-phosphate acyltransferase PlsY
VTFWLLVAFAYAVGSIPFGLLMGRMFADVDVRTMGSGNIGATNVNRVLGRKLGALTLLCDLSKGALCVLLAKLLLPHRELDHLWIGFAAFLGHCYPLYLGFKGGKGVATAAGILLFVSPYTALLGLLVWIVVVKISKVSSLGALVASICIPAIAYVLERDLRLTFVMTLMMGIVVWRHRENIARLRQGAEK